MYKFLGTQKLPILTQGETENLNRPETCRDWIGKSDRSETCRDWIEKSE